MKVLTTSLFVLALFGAAFAQGKPGAFVERLKGNDGSQTGAQLRAQTNVVGGDSKQAGVVPEPATLAVLGLGAAAILRKRAKKA